MRKQAVILFGALLARTAMFAQFPPENALRLGNWDFTGSDKAGVVWEGTLTIGELDPSRFDPDPAKYSHRCHLELRSAKSGRGKDMPCLYDGRTRLFSFDGGAFSNKYSYSAMLSTDGKRLMDGRWIEGNGETGTWSAMSSEPSKHAASAEARTPGAVIAPSRPGAAKVTAVRLHLVPESYAGTCPTPLKLVAEITTDGPGTVWYQFLAGAVSKNGPAEGTVTFDAAGTRSATLEATVTRTPAVPHASFIAAMEDARGTHGPRNVSSGPVDYNTTCQR